MKVCELINRLQELPQDATIGTFRSDDLLNKRGFVVVFSYSPTHVKLDSETDYYNIAHNVHNGDCDYYIGF